MLRVELGNDFIEIVYFGEMISRNNSHFGNGRLKPSSRTYKDFITTQILKSAQDKQIFDKNAKFKRHFQLNIGKSVGLKKDGNMVKRKWDIDNYIKIPTDCLCNAIGIDDSYILVEYNTKKVVEDKLHGFCLRIEII